MAEENSVKEMSFWEHLDELRGTLFRSLIAILLMSSAGLIFRTQLFDIILMPSKSDFIIYRLLNWNFGMKLINVDVSAQFFVHLKASLISGVILAFPYVVYQIWKFIAPALYEREEVAVKSAMLLSAILFYIGVLVGFFFVLPVCLQFFMGYTVSPDIINTITLSSYMSTFTSLVLMIGIVFEFPSAVLVLSQLGIVTRSMLRKGRKYAIVIIMILAAIITPSDPFSMIILSIPLYVLYEFSILMCKETPVAEEDNQEG